MLDEIARGLGFVRDYLTTGATTGRFSAFVRTLLGPLLDELGFTAAPGDGDDRRTLRATVIAVLGVLGDDPDVVARARSAADRAATGGSGVDATTAGAVVRVAARHGDARLFDALFAAADHAADPDEHYRYLYALAEFRDPPLIDRGLGLAVTPQIRTQDTASYLGQFFANAGFPRTSAVRSISSPAVPTSLTRSCDQLCSTFRFSGISTIGSMISLSPHPARGKVETIDAASERAESALRRRGSVRASDIARLLESYLPSAAFSSPVVAEWLDNTRR